LTPTLPIDVAKLTPAECQEYLTAEVAQYYADPMGFVRAAYPWGKPGPLEQFAGPDQWQVEVLEEIGAEVLKRDFRGFEPVAPLRESIASGHGIGKSTLVAWLVNWIMSTRPGCQGTVTANTVSQLETKTWPAVDKWTKLCFTRDWFMLGTTSIRSVTDPRNWFCVAQTAREENSEAFAGQHAATSTSFYIFDEASAVPDGIWEVAEGGLTDGEPMFFAFGNPTRSSGKFYRITFGDERERWLHRSIDSRTAARSNKTQIAEWIADYGIDSDFIRVRVLGLPPKASELQYIDFDRIEAARKRTVEVLEDEPLVAGFDVSGGGSAWNVIWFRRGLDARSIPPIRIPGEHGRDRAVLIGIAAEVMRDRTKGKHVAAMFVDSAFGAPIVERLHTLGYDNVHEINFGGPSQDFHMANCRAYMWSKTKDWLLKGAIPNQEEIARQLGSPGYHINNSNKLVIEAKADMGKRGEPSPDDADALCLTFAQPVAPVAAQEPEDFGAFGGGDFDSGLGGGGWMS
jgi:hypothetical protein